MSTIVIAAVILTNDKGQILSVRKRGTQSYMMPGGKVEPGETTRQTVVREIREELDIVLDEDKLTFFGSYTAPAANEPGYDVACDVYIYPMPLHSLPSPHAEIVEAVFLEANDDRPVIAPLSRDVVFPAYVEYIAEQS